MQSRAWHIMLAVSCAVLLAGAGLAAGQDTPMIRSDDTPSPVSADVRINQIEASQFPQVVIFATVRRDGVPVPGLTAADFRVREDDVDHEPLTQAPLTVAPRLTPLSVVLALDTSGSMKKWLHDEQTAVKSFLSTLQPQDRVQVMRFAGDVKTLYPLGTDRELAADAIASTVARGDTALWDALYAAVESLRSVVGRKAIILLSDGVDDNGHGKPLSQRTVTDVLALAHQVNVPIYIVGLGIELDERNLKQVASDTGGLYFNTVKASELKRLYDHIGQQLAGQYTISYTSDVPAHGPKHRVQLQFGAVVSTKSYLPASTMAAQPGPRPRAAPVITEVPDRPAPVEQVKRVTRD
jgi:VWFA-related protein